MSDTPETDAAAVSREFIAREMDRYSHKFVLADHARDLERQRDALKAELAAVREDAERYRWLRSTCVVRDRGYEGGQWLEFEEVGYPQAWLESPRKSDSEIVDAAIDAARKP